MREDPDAAQSITRAVGAANVAHPAEQSNLRSAPLENCVRPKQPEFSPRMDPTTMVTVVSDASGIAGIVQLLRG